MERIKIDKEEVIERLGIRNDVNNMIYILDATSYFHKYEFFVEKKEDNYTVCSVDENGTRKNSSIFYDNKTDALLASQHEILLFIYDIIIKHERMYLSQRKEKSIDFSAYFLTKKITNLLSLKIKSEKRKKIDQTTLDAMIENHLQWLHSKGEKGERFELKCTDLTGLDLSDADLTEAYIYRCDISKANLRGVSLYRATIEETHKDGSDFSETNIDAFWGDCY